jgi:hypothetical protein
MPLDLTAPVTLPGYLIEVAFDPPRYFSTRGVQLWATHTWVSSGWVYTEDKLELPGGDPAFTQLILSQGVVGRVVRVWMFYGNTASDANTVLTYEGVIDGAPSLVNGITLTLFDRAIATLYAPRRRVRAELGFSVLPQRGLKIVWNGITIVFKDQAQ